jgi:transposase
MIFALHLCMARLQIISVKEKPEELNKLISKSAHSVKPRIKMLLAIAQGIVSTGELVGKVKANRNSILNWKNAYQLNGIQGLLEDNRGGTRSAAINEKQKKQLQQKLSSPKDGFTSYTQAVDWINETFGLQMNYHAVNKYLKRHFGTKLKVGRKTHVNKDDNAAALFKKTI